MNVIKMEPINLRTFPYRFPTLLLVTRPSLFIIIKWFHTFMHFDYLNIHTWALDSTLLTVLTLIPLS